MDEANAVEATEQGAAEAPAEEAVSSEIAMYRQQLLFFARRLAAQGLLDETSRAGSSLLR